MNRHRRGGIVLRLWSGEIFCGIMQHMWYLYLDESGDLGFDFVNKRPSNFFTITIVVVQGIEENRKLMKAVRVTLRRKLNPRKHRKRFIQELKGSSTAMSIKRYFYTRISTVEFGIYSITLNKRRVYERLTHEKTRVYNFIARQVLDRIPFESNRGNRVEFILDKSKSKPEIVEFNTYIHNQLAGRLHPDTILDMYHWNSHETPGLQVADMFSWGIFQSYERKNKEWLDIFQKKISLNKPYL